MLKKSKHGWVGFDIGAASVKAVQLVRQDGAYSIRSAAMVPRSERWAAASLTENEPRSSGDELRAAASLCERLAGADAAAVVPSAMCDVYLADAPTAKRGVEVDVLRAIEAATDRTQRNRLYDTWPVGLQAGKINVVTAPQAWSDQISADVIQGGWLCQSIDAPAWALARAIALAAPESGAHLTAALDWGYGRATMCLVHEGVPALVRVLKDCAFQNLLDALSRQLRIDERDAEIVLQRHGLSASGASTHGATARLILDILAEPLGRLVQEIRRTLSYWQGVTRGKLPQTIYVFGGGGTLADVDGRLASALDIAVETWTLPVESPNGNTPPAALLGAAAGLSALAWEEL